MDWQKISLELIALGRDFWDGIWHILPFLAIGVLIGAAIRTWKFHVRLRRACELRLWAVLGATVIAVIGPLCACGAAIMVSLHLGCRSRRWPAGGFAADDIEGYMVGNFSGRPGPTPNSRPPSSWAFSPGW
jgi:hypothetical protein